MSVVESAAHSALIGQKAIPHPLDNLLKHAGVLKKKKKKKKKGN